MTEYKVMDGPTVAAVTNKNILDVRNLNEWRGGKVENAYLISLPEIK